jgi:hypothetical protein
MEIEIIKMCEILSDKVKKKKSNKEGRKNKIIDLEK